MNEKLTLEDYHKKYPARPGDTVEKFEKYEAFCAKNPCPQTVEGYLQWYAKLAAWMENKNTEFHQDINVYQIILRGDGKYYIKYTSHRKGRELGSFTVSHMIGSTYLDSFEEASKALEEYKEKLRLDAIKAKETVVHEEIYPPIDKNEN